MNLVAYIKTYYEKSLFWAVKPHPPQDAGHGYRTIRPGTIRSGTIRPRTIRPKI